MAPFNFATAAATCSTWLGWAKSILQENYTAPNKLEKARYSLLGHRILHLNKLGQDTRGSSGRKIRSIRLKEETGQRNHPSHLMQMSCPERSKQITNCIHNYIHSLGIGDQSSETNLASREGVEPVRS